MVFRCRCLIAIATIAAVLRLELPALYYKLPIGLCRCILKSINASMLYNLSLAWNKCDLPVGIPIIKTRQLWHHLILKMRIGEDTRKDGLYIETGSWGMAVGFEDKPCKQSNTYIQLYPNIYIYIPIYSTLSQLYPSPPAQWGYIMLWEEQYGCG